MRLCISEKICGRCAEAIRIHVQECITFDEGHPSIVLSSPKQRPKRHPAAILVDDRHVVFPREGEKSGYEAGGAIDRGLNLLQRAASNGRIRRRRRNLRLNAQACQRGTQLVRGGGRELGLATPCCAKAGPPP